MFSVTFQWVINILLLYMYYYTTHVVLISVGLLLLLSHRWPGVTPPTGWNPSSLGSECQTRRRGKECADSTIVCGERESALKKLPSAPSFETQWSHDLETLWAYFDMIGFLPRAGKFVWTTNASEQKVFTGEPNTHTSVGIFNPNLMFMLKYSENEFVQNLADIFSSCSDQSVSKN